MSTLISPGTEVPIIDESFYIPGSKSAIPLIFIATAAEKNQPNGQPATGTYEHNIVRTITSVTQSVRLYGVPRFLRDSSDKPHHGDCRNEYGLLALNQYLGIGDRAYVVRANVNLNDSRETIEDLWDSKVSSTLSPAGAAYVMEGYLNTYLYEYNVNNGFVYGDAGYRTTVNQAELTTYAIKAMDYVFGSVSDGVNTVFVDATFRKVRSIVFANHTPGLTMYPAGLDNPPSVDAFLGFHGHAAEWVSTASGSAVSGEWTPAEARNFLIDVCRDFSTTREFITATTLGNTDAARRVAIVEALQEVINKNQAIRSEQFEYDLIVCPGFPEVADELVALAADIKDEAFIIGATPMHLDPEFVVNWGKTAERQRSNSIAYYYPHSLMSNLDGRMVVGCASGTALRTYAYNDSVSFPWFAPAGTTRGQVQGVQAVGYVVGNLGEGTEFEEVALNQGQRDALYQFGSDINPIVFFPGRGILIWGQKTSQPDASARDRVNVERLLRKAKRDIRKHTMPFVFQPNDPITRGNLKAVLDNYFGDIMMKRGLYDFVTVCNELNNSPAVIDRNEMVADAALRPTKTAEFIYVPLRILATGADT